MLVFSCGGGFGVGGSDAGFQLCFCGGIDLL